MKRQPLLRMFAAVTFTCLPTCLIAQTPAAQTLTFDVASVRQNKSGFPPTGDEPSTNLTLGPGDIYNSTGGYVVIRNQPLLRFVIFAYKLTNSQYLEVFNASPDWVRHSLYDIQARTDKPNVTKDELRLMMQSLLATRFGLVAHFEAKNEAVLAMHFVKPGTLGPRLRPHPASDSCSRAAPSLVPVPASAATPTAPLPPVTMEGGFPVACGGLLVLPSSTLRLVNVGGRDVSLASMAGDFGLWGSLPRTVVDDTGLTGNYDFALDYVPAQPEPPPGAPAPPGDLQANFVDSVRRQLGLKFDSERHDVQVLVIDHIAPLTDN